MAKAILTQGKVSQGLINLTLPMIFGISSSLVAAVFETYLIGMIGTTELAAYSFTSPVVMSITSFMLGISIGLSSVLARAVGTGNSENVTRLATDGVLLMALVMTVLAIIGYLLIDPLFSRMGAEGQTLNLIHSYMAIWYIGLLFFALPSIGSNALRATGEAKLAGYIMVAASILQMILDPILILGWFGVPQLGVQGAAWAMLLSRIVICAFTFYFLINRKELISFAGLAMDKVLHSWREILKVGLPATFTNLISPLSQMFVVGLLAKYGDAAVAGAGIAGRLEGLFIIPLFALSASIGPFVGQNWGAQEFGRANKAMKLSFAWSMIWGFGVALIFLAFREPLAGLLADDPDVIKYAALYLLLVPFSYGFWGVLMMTSATFNSLGKPLASTTLSVLRMIIIYVPAAYIGDHLAGVTGIFLAAFVASTLVGIAGFVWNRKVYTKPQTA